METEAQGTTQGKDDGASNVVRLPRDWLGPREELVPFGPAADRAEQAARAAAAAASATPAAPAAEAQVVELSSRHTPTDAGTGESPDCTQDDFWGGDLEAIPKPVLGPRPSDIDVPAESFGAAPKVPVAVEPGGAPLEVPHPRPRRRRTRSLGSGRTGSAGLGRARSAGSRCTGPAGSRRTRSADPFGLRVRARSAALGGALVAAALAAALVATSLGPGSPARESHGVRTLLSAASTLALPARLDVLPHHTARARTAVTATHRAHTRAHHSPTPRAGTPTFVKVSTPSQTAPASITSTSSASTAAPVVSREPAPTSSTTPKTTSASTASTHKTSSGPVGKGAPFGPGQLG